MSKALLLDKDNQAVRDARRLHDKLEKMAMYTAYHAGAGSDRSESVKKLLEMCRRLHDNVTEHRDTDWDTTKSEDADPAPRRGRPRKEG